MNYFDSILWTVCLAELAERSPPTPEVDSSYPFVGNFFIQNLHLLPTVDTKTKEKRGLEWAIKKSHIEAYFGLQNFKKLIQTSP